MYQPPFEACSTAGRKITVTGRVFSADSHTVLYPQGLEIDGLIPGFVCLFVLNTSVFPAGSAVLRYHNVLPLESCVERKTHLVINNLR